MCLVSSPLKASNPNSGNCCCEKEKALLCVLSKIWKFRRRNKYICWSTKDGCSRRKKVKKKRRYACRVFLFRMFKVFVSFTCALADFCRLVWLTRESTSIKWLEFLSHLWPTWPTSYWTTTPFTIVHFTFKFLGEERSHHIEKVIGERKTR